MALRDEHRVEFSRPVRQIFMMAGVLALVALAVILLAAQVRTVFAANPYLNGFIAGVFLLGVAATFWQVRQLQAATTWLRDLQAGHKGHEFVQPPALLAAMAPMVREGQIKKRLAASSTRSILDSVAVRLDESREITRYIINLLIFLGLLGTFWGLALTVPAVVDTVRSLAPRPGEVGTGAGFDRLMTGLESQLGGMGTAFASSLIGLAGSLVVGLLELFAGHGQNRFYREIEEWLTSFTRLGLVSEGEGPDGALVSLLERVDEGLEKTTEFAARAEEARMVSEERLAGAADVVAGMVEHIDSERQVMTALLKEMQDQRDKEAGRDHATLTVLKRIDQGQSHVSQTTANLASVLERVLNRENDPRRNAEIESVERQISLLAEDISVGRQESTRAIRAELRTLIKLIDERTKTGAL